jgi:hypothetical protein
VGFGQSYGRLISEQLVFLVARRAVARLEGIQNSIDVEEKEGAIADTR